MQKDVYILPPGMYKPSHGQFGLRRSTGRIQWYHCREAFHAHAPLWKHEFYFSLPKDCRRSFCDFFDQIEEQLRLRYRTRIHQTNVPDIICIRPAPFWHRAWLRYSLFTVLCRSGSIYEPHLGMETALRSTNYVKDTWRAVDLFLSGRTRYTGYATGWVNAFDNIQCVGFAKCRHADRRCRRKLDARLVPGWQVFPIYTLFRLGRLCLRLCRKIPGLFTAAKVQSVK